MASSLTELTSCYGKKKFTGKRRYFNLVMCILKKNKGFDEGVNILKTERGFRKDCLPEKVLLRPQA